MYIFTEKRKQNFEQMRVKAHKLKQHCIYCSIETNKSNIKKHEQYCYLNPNNIKLCPVCQSPIKNYKISHTCSYSCANSLFRSGPNNGNWEERSYRSTCFHYHKKECIICKENNIVEVHHLDENKNNNNPENLIPLCPTHHQYWHSQFKKLVELQIQNYIQNWKKELSATQESNLQPSGPKPDALPS